MHYALRTVNYALSTLYYILIVLLASCGRSYDPAGEQSSLLPPITPDYCNVVMPCNIAAPSFMVEGATHVRAEVQALSADGTTLNSVTIEGDSEINLSEAFDTSNLTPPTSHLIHTLSVTLSTWSDRHTNGIQYTPFTITLSADSIDRYLSYRLIPPGYEGWHSMGIYERDLSTYEEVALVCIDDASQGCVNCHTPSWGDGRHTLYHKRGEGGGTQFSLPNDSSFFVNLRELGQQGSYPAWHPSARYVVFASTETHQSFYHNSRDKIEVYDLGGQLFCFDIANKRQIVANELADSCWRTFPSFSPDGALLYYCRAQAVDMPHDVDSLHYALCVADFDEHTGIISNERTLAEHLAESMHATDDAKDMQTHAREHCEAVTANVIGNADMQTPAREHCEAVTADVINNVMRSASFPRVSPSGRYLMYTTHDCGTFPIWHREADLAMIDLVSGEAVDVSALNSNEVESYHSWSTNSRWIVFSSRRDDGRYTRLYIAHIDEMGRASKPFMLPQRSPQHDLLLLDSYNVPELIKE